MPPELSGIDHIHVHVPDRAAAEAWYARVLGFQRFEQYAGWATPDGPLMIGNALGTIQLALFEGRLQGHSQGHGGTIAMTADGQGFLDWLAHLNEVLDESVEPVDHGLAWSLYFRDPAGNPYEITTEDYERVASKL